MDKLSQLREMTDVVADTGDIEAIAKYQPVDATTNPSLLLKAAQMPQYAALIDAEASAVAAQNVSEAEAVTLLGDRFAVAIGREITRIIPGRISTEVDARLSFDRDASVATARRIIALYNEAGIGRERVLIKLASTWEGIEAARVLEAEGINCNLTLMFADIQAVAAAEAGAFLISPFVGRILDWHKKDTGRDSYPAEEDPGVLSVRNIYQLYKDRGYKTVVMGASFRNAGEIEALAGCDRLTIGPNFLEELSNDTGHLARVLSPDERKPYTDYTLEGEADFRFQMNSNAMATEKLAEGIRSFVADQITLETLLAGKLAAAA
ncbi:MAG: transaldolase [Pseudomonadota bacterium]